jgi:hypothetical protein
VFSISKASYIKWVRVSGWYDLIVTAPFATPWTFVWLYGLLQAAATSAHLPGEFSPLTAGHVLMANLMGSVVVVWSLARAWAPTVLLGRLDGVARLLFASWQIYAVTSGVSAIVLMFTALELIFGGLQWLKIREAH